MKRVLLGLAASAALVAPAAAATVTQSHSLTSGTGARSGMFDISSIYTSAAANGYDVVLNSARMSVYGYSAYDRDFAATYSHSTRDCSWFSCGSTYHYNALDGDRTVDRLWAGLGASGYDFYDTTYSRRTTSGAFRSGNSVYHTTTYYNYGSLYGSTYASDSELADLDVDGMIAYRIYTSGDPTSNLRASLTVDYDLVAQVPLPASGLMLLGAVGAMGYVRRKRKAG